MNVDMLLSNATLCDAIQNQELDTVLDLLEELKRYSGVCILSESRYEELIDFIYTHHREEDCIRLSRLLEKEMARGQIVMDGPRYETEKREILRHCELETAVFQEALEGEGDFDASYLVVCCEDQEGLRYVFQTEELQKVMILLEDSTDSLLEFSQDLPVLYRELVFDKKIKDSMERLEAGFLCRRKEILHHLYCIQKEIPDLLHKYGPMDNQSLGDRMSVSCSPERSRKTVKNELTKQADHGEIVCEMHTKMKKIGTRPPDRIYFCASVPKGIQIDKKDLSEKIYIYKITKHAGVSKKKK